MSSIASEIDFGLGCNVDQPHERLALAGIATTCQPTGDTEIPNTLGLLNVLTVNNQGRFNSCCGNATDKALEWDAWVGSRQRVNLSARFSYLAGRRWAGINDGPDQGLSIAAGAMGSHEIGTVEESEFPYWGPSDRFSSHIPGDLIDRAAKHRVRAAAEAHDSREILQRLGTGQGATIIGIWWTATLANYRGGVPITEVPGGRNLGGHALACCDYEIHGGRQFLRIWNSHGTDWGDRGTMLVASDVVDRWLDKGPFGAWTVTGLSGFQKRPFRVEGLMQ